MTKNHFVPTLENRLRKIALSTTLLITALRPDEDSEVFDDETIDAMQTLAYKIREEVGLIQRLPSHLQNIKVPTNEEIPGLEDIEGIEAIEAAANAAIRSTTTETLLQWYSRHEADVAVKQLRKDMGALDGRRAPRTKGGAK